MPLVTVIIPTHNRESLLKRAVDSVLSQSHEAIELIVADDASTDGTQNLVDQYRKRDARVLYISSTENIGAAAIRNRAARTASGAILCFLDDDDEWLPNKVERQIECLEGYSMVGCLSHRSDGYETAGGLVLQSRASEKTRTGSSVFLSEIGLNEVFFDNGRLSPSSVMMRTEEFLKIGGFDETLVASQGRDLFVRMVHTFGTALLIREHLVVHFQRHGLKRISTSRNHLIGGWAEFKKNQHLMSDRLIHWRLFMLNAREAKFASTYKVKAVFILKALSHVRLWRLKDHAKTLAALLLLK